MDIMVRKPRGNSFIFDMLFHHTCHEAKEKREKEREREIRILFPSWLDLFLLSISVSFCFLCCSMVRLFHHFKVIRLKKVMQALHIQNFD